MLFVEINKYLFVIDKTFFLLKENFIYDFHSLNDGMIHIGCLVFPRAESASRVDAFAFQPWLNNAQGVVTIHCGHRIAIWNIDCICAADMRPILLADQAGINEALNGFTDDLFFVYRGSPGEGHFAHKREILCDVGDIVWRVIGEIGDSVAWGYGFGKIHPAFFGCIGPIETDTDNQTSVGDEFLCGFLNMLWRVCDA